jgi:hypothetical protein
MAVISLRARCTNCGADELLSRIADDAGSCPFCQLSFCDDDSSLFLREVLRADVAYRLLIRSLRHLPLRGFTCGSFPSRCSSAWPPGCPGRRGPTSPLP